MKNKSITTVFLWQLLGKFAIQGISFLTVPMFTRIMTPTDYGLYAVYSSWLSFLSLFIGLQTSASIANAKIKYSFSDYKEYLSSVLSISFFSFLFIFIIAFVFRKKIGTTLGFNEYLVVFMVLQSFFNYCFNFYLTILMQDKNSKQNALYASLVSLSGTLLALVFVINFSYYKYVLKIFGYAIPIFISGLLSIFVIYKEGKKLFNRRYWSFCLTFSLPLIMHGAACIVLNQSDRIMLKTLQNESLTGIYSVAYNLALVINVIAIAANTAWIPFYYEYEKKDNYLQIREKFKNYLFNFTIITLGFTLCCPEVFKIIAPKGYWQGLQLLPIIALSYYFDFLYMFSVNFELYMEKVKYISSATIIAAVINIVGNYFLIPKYGIIGAGITTLYSYIFLLVFHDIVARFVIKEKEFFINITSYAKGFVPVSLMVCLYYFMLNLWYVRWSLAVILGIILLIRIIKNRGFF